jgi:hypothetical protein
MIIAYEILKIFMPKKVFVFWREKKKKSFCREKNGGKNKMAALAKKKLWCR